MNLSDLKSSISLDLALKPQSEALAVKAIDSISAGIDELAKLGYRFALVPSDSPHAPSAPEEFPKMLYKVGAVPPELTVTDEDSESKARAEGYSALGEPAPALPALEPEHEQVEDTEAHDEP